MPLLEASCWRLCRRLRMMKRTRPSPAVRSASQKFMSAKSHRGLQQPVALYAKHWTDNTLCLHLSLLCMYVCVCVRVC